MRQTCVERCRLAYACGQHWNDLERLPENDRVRFCVRCRTAVHLAHTSAEFAALAAQGRCVAIAGRTGAMQVGRPAGDDDA